MRSAINLFCSAAIVAYAVPAMAQEAAPVSQDGLEEIVVTAQKREQSLQNVPVAVTALNAETLASRNVSNVSDLTKLAPSLTVTQSNTPANNSINLRGIGTFAFSVGVEPSVAVIVDDVALLQQSQAFSGLSDIARIEVLRGPQGTLFGRAAAAGAINIVSQAPSDTFTGAVGAGATTDGQYRADAMLSGPIAEGVKFRVNGFYSIFEGNMQDLQSGRWLNKNRSYGARGRLSIAATSNLNLDLTAAYSVDNTDGVVRPFVAVPTGAAIFGTPIAANIAGITPGIDNRRVRVNVLPFNRSKQFVGSAKAALDLGSAQLISVTSYQDWRFRFFEDFDLLAAPVLGLADGIYAGGPFHARQFSQEFRVVSKGRQTVDYVAGVYYANGRTYRGFNRGPAGSAVAAQWSADAGSETMAAFAQATLNVSDGTHIDGGLRYNHQKIDAHFRNEITPVTPPANNATCLSTCVGKASDNAVTGKIALRQDFTPKVMGYVSFATGYKGPGFDISSGFTPVRASNPVRPETSNSYEVGIKSRFFDNRLQLNVAGFWTDYKDYQAQSGTLLPDNTIQLVLNNVGSLRTRGVEVELSAKPVPQLRIDGAFNYTDAKVRSFPLAQCYTGQTAAQGCLDQDPGPAVANFQNLAGARLANAPRIKWNLGANYDIILPNQPFNAFVQADFNYQTKVNFDLLGNPTTVQKAYGILNTSIGLQPSGDHGLTVAFYVNNVFDKHYAANLSTPSGGALGTLIGVLPREAWRFFGVKARYTF